ncbi:unnamed protein product [Meloidogyne enterolobii]|uniref:Uncharacterized protein n=2 Tax=Meloidogyne enterolobii TaxID=390850 RepID=A0A6V7XHS9_MELEN|nr:unnamed protein product [Meloidogyne enterolobii]
MSKFFFALVIVTIVFIHCCDAGKGKNKQKSKPQSGYSNPAAGMGQQQSSSGTQSGDQSSVNTQHLNHLIGHATGYDPHGNEYVFQG